MKYTYIKPPFQLIKINGKKTPFICYTILNSKHKVRINIYL